MAIDRRDFLKGFGGLCAAVGIGAGVNLVPGKAFASSGSVSQGAADSSAIRWGMVIDTTKFDEHSINVCADACHTEHNVPKFDNVKDELMWIWAVKYAEAFPSQSHQFLADKVEGNKVAVLCNHCAAPACVRVCPTQATFKSADGITQMDMHRCIGCRYCMAACPYGARSFNWRDPRIDDTTLVGGAKINPKYPTRERGVVEKCLFCTERIMKGPMPGPGQELSEEQTPLCVLKAPEGAMVFGNLNDPKSKIRQVLAQNHFIQRKAEAGTNPSVFYIF